MFQRGTNRWHSAGLIALTIAACTPIDDVPDCASDADCRNGTHCNVDARRCELHGASNEAGQDTTCAADGDCEHGPCERASCHEQRCELTPVEDRTPVPDADQTQNDCARSLCDGKGGQRDEPDDADLPRSDGNPCHRLSCAGGAMQVMPLADGEACNDQGVCQGGECSECVAETDCTGTHDCTIMRIQCSDDGPRCVSTMLSIPSKTCGPGLVCSAGECVSCMVGASCDVELPCHAGRITSCNPRVCEPQPSSGGDCGTDAAGHPLTCHAGECSYACPAGSCQPSSDPCRVNQWSCAQPNAEPSCVEQMAEDGKECGDNSACHAGRCVRAALVNGDLSQGTLGWTLSEEAARFQFYQDPGNDNRWSLTTWVEDPPGSANGDTATGTMAQTFTVPDDAVALRFAICGGHAHIRLRDANNAVVEDVTATDTNDIRIPVSWDLTGRRGQSLTISIEDDISQPYWNFVGTSGFDVIREGDFGLANGQFSAGLDGWTPNGDGQYFAVFDDYNHDMDAQYGRRRSVTSYVSDAAATNKATAAIGSLSQSFVVPLDALALRFHVSGGKTGQVVLYDGESSISGTTADNSSTTKVPKSWDLTSYRGKRLRLEIIDRVSAGQWDYIAVSGFDIVTTWNGP